MSLRDADSLSKSAKIRILSEQTINQIAAGEVIENPASVIKELVENAIDARSKQITIEVLAGGFQCIKVSDDGCGMTPDDAVLCLERHATSKIIDAQDLFDLVTMGFRGEALASIAAISKMTLLTASENTPAVFLEIEGGKIEHTSLGARSQGTTIEIRSLFYNVPARKKFQKSAATSSAEITKIVTQLALAHPEVGFELIVQNRSHFCLPPSEESFLNQLKKRTTLLLGEDFVASSHSFECHEGKYGIKGLVGNPSFSRHNRSGQYIFINRRPVSCFPLSYAIRDAYGTRLSSDRHPVFLLHLSVPPELIDVNVHPQKKEIRLRDESIVKHTLHSTINEVLSGATPISLEMPYVFEQQKSLPPFLQGEIPNFSTPLVLKEERQEEPHPEMRFSLELSVIGLYRHYLIVAAESFDSVLPFPSPGLVWVDLFAAEMRIHFERLLREDTFSLCQGLLIPLTLSFSRAETQLLKANLEAVQKLGIQVREIGPTVFLVEGIPPFLKEEEAKNALEEIIAELQGLEEEKIQAQEKKRQLATCLCRKIRSHQRSYTLMEGRYLVKQLLQAKDPLHCPQGKKTLFFMKEEEIESDFTRKSIPSCTIEALTEGFKKCKP